MKNTKGFTLIEMIMVITLLGIIAAIIAIPLLQGARGWFDATTREGITQSGRIGIERMTREIRNTARKVNNTPCISAASVTPPVYTFSDMNGDLTNCNSIKFSLSGTEIKRNEGMADEAVLADNVSTLTINYYDSSNALLSDPITASNIRRLSIEIESTKGTETLRKYNEVYLSNMRGY